MSILLGYYKTSGGIIISMWTDENNNINSKKLPVYHKKYPIISDINAIFRKRNIIYPPVLFHIDKRILLRKYHIWRVIRGFQLCTDCCPNGNEGGKPRDWAVCCWCHNTKQYGHQIYNNDIPKYTKHLPIPN